jgi:hypothetical protein
MPRVVNVQARTRLGGLDVDNTETDQLCDRLFLAAPNA